MAGIPEPNYATGLVSNTGYLSKPLVDLLKALARAAAESPTATLDELIARVTALETASGATYYGPPSGGIEVDGGAIRLRLLADSGLGQILGITRDQFGRLSGTRAVTTTDLAEGANLYFTVARARAAAVADALVDGVVDVAPSQNAVVDALAALVVDSIVDADTTHAPSRNAVFDALAVEVAARDAAIAAAIAGLSWKQQVRVATTTAGTLASSFENGDTIDGVVLATGDRILIKNQATASQNGIYVVKATGAPARSTDADAGAELVNASLYVSEGTLNADTQWVCTTNAPITIGSTAIAFAQLSAGSGSTPTGTGFRHVTAGSEDAATVTIDGQGTASAGDVKVVAPATHAATSKATPIDADELPIVDTAASNVLKRLTWANLKATLKTYFDTLYTAPGSPASYLNSLSVAPVCALGLRKLISTATVAIRVRRSSDNAEQDIGFTGNGLDTASLLTFVGANNGFVTKFYDQTGGGFDAVQATSTKQPQIVVSGSYLGYALFDQVDDAMKITSLTQGTPYAGVYFRGAFNFAAGGGFYVIFESSVDMNSNAQTWAIDINASTIRALSQNGSGVNYRLSTFASAYGGISNLLTVLFNRVRTGNAEIAVWDEGGPVNPTPVNTVEQTGNYTTYDVYLGGRGGAANYSSIAMECWAFYSADTTFKRRSIETIIGSEG